MKNYFSLIALMMALVSCQTEKLVEETTTSNVVYQAYTDADENTKTSMDQDFNVIWSEGDEVSIFEGSAVNQKYRTKTSGSTSTEMEFVGGSSFVAGTEIASNVAVYPYSSELSIKKSGDKYTVGNVVFPEAQVYAESSFGKDVAPMVAVTSSTSDKVLKFKNAFGGVNLQLVGTDKIKSITLSGNNGEVICGAANVSVSNAVVPEVTMTGTGTLITLECGEGVQLNESTPTSFYIVLPPVVMANGFTAIVTDTEGKTMTMSSSKAQTISRNTMLNMPSKVFSGVVDESKTPLTFIAEEAGSKVALYKEGYPYDVLQSYSIDGKTWNDYTFSQVITLQNVGDYVCFKKRDDGIAVGFNKNEPYAEEDENYYGNNMYYFRMTGRIASKGNLMSLLDNTCVTKEIPNAGCFMGLFADCASLTKAPLLPATTLKPWCYDDLFSGCTNLLNAPNLPSVTLEEYCYSRMFSDCYSLTDAPELLSPEMKMGCYYSMFENCTSLKTASELNALILADQCYEYMFKGCTSLEESVELPAKEVGSRSYMQMFAGCYSIKRAKDIKAETLSKSSCSSMFSGCTSLESTPKFAPVQLAEECCSYMFNNCRSMRTVMDALPALKLEKECYYYMFCGCSSITKSPYLPAPYLATNCYAGLFSHCSRLNEVRCAAQDLEEGNYNCTILWLFHVSSIGTFYANPAYMWGRGDGGVPVGWSLEYEM